MTSKSAWIFNPKKHPEVQNLLYSVQTSEMHRLTSNWPWILNSQNTYLCGPNSILFSLRPGFLLLFFFFFEIQGWGKCTEWPQTDLKHVTVQNTPMYEVLAPEAKFLLRFPLRRPFLRYKVVEIRKAPHVIKLNNNSQTYLVYAIILTPVPQFGSISLYGHTVFNI